jgi:hypothetical protein
MAAGLADIAGDGLSHRLRAGNERRSLAADERRETQMTTKGDERLYLVRTRNWSDDASKIEKQKSKIASSHLLPTRNVNRLPCHIARLIRC